MSTAPQSTEILVDRVCFDIIGKTESGHELRCWTDGDRVVWQDDEGRSGYMPAMLFRLAAHSLAHYCEDVCCATDSEHQDDFIRAWEDSVSCPVDLAMAHPYWMDSDDQRNNLRFGFASVAINAALDVQPDGLKQRGDYRMTKAEASVGSFRDAFQIVEDRRFDDNGETSTWWAVRTPDGQMYLDENGGGWKPMPQVMAGWFMAEQSARQALLVAPCPPGIEPTAGDWSEAGQCEENPPTKPVIGWARVNVKTGYIYYTDDRHQMMISMQEELHCPPHWNSQPVHIAPVATHKVVALAANRDHPQGDIVGQAQAWEAVCRALDKACPAWGKMEKTGEKSAVAAILLLGRLAKPNEPDGLAEDRCKQCGKRCPNATCAACQWANSQPVPKGGAD